MGRPSSYTPELAAEICERLLAGESLRSIIGLAHMPARSTVLKWIAEDTDGFSAQYAHAKDQGLDDRAEAAVEAAKGADDAAKGRLAFDAERWYLGKTARRFSDKVAIEHSGSVQTSENMTEADLERIAAGGSAGIAEAPQGPFIVRDVL